MGFIYLLMQLRCMTYDPTLLGGIALSVAFLALLVWLMLRSANEPEWSKISQGARSARNARERRE